MRIDPSQVYICPEHGCVYWIEDHDVLMYAPLSNRGDVVWHEYSEVQLDALTESQRKTINSVYTHLLQKQKTHKV
jgi:hypothetical protein